MLDSKYNWEKHEQGGNSNCFYKGNKKSSLVLHAWFVKAVDENQPLSKETFPHEQVEGYFSVAVEYKGHIFLCSDKIRSTPLYYFHDCQLFYWSNSARRLLEKIDNPQIDINARLELQMSGYVTGRQTLYSSLCQVQAGEFVVFKSPENILVRERYYLYYKPGEREGSEEFFIDELENVTNGIIERNIKQAAGAPIWVPLSGGLDSRLLVYKLKEFGYKNIHSFSYGAKGNLEALIAKEVSRKLDIPWFFIESSRKDIRKYFWSERRRAYWEYADGLHVIPNIHWIHCTEYLREKNLIDDTVYFMNGQSGDFVAGNHIPGFPAGQIFSFDLLVRKILDKHFSLHHKLAVDLHSISVISDKIRKTLASFDIEEPCDYLSFAKLYELWEWQERQCKRVVNGQQTYEHYGHKWLLPLWDDAYMDFWVDLPLVHKINRGLFIKHLEKIDRGGVFKGYSPVVYRWPKSFFFVLPIGWGLKLLFGDNVSGRFYRCLDYFSMYSTLYAPFCFQEYMANCDTFRSPLGFFEKVYLQELGNES